MTLREAALAVVENARDQGRDDCMDDNERVAWRCMCGREGSSFVFNLRKAKAACTHRR